MSKEHFEWDVRKDAENLAKHGISFAEAQYAFADPKRVIARDLQHSSKREERFYCFGQIGEGIVTVRFTFRCNMIRIFGAGYWRKGKRIYEHKNKVYRRTHR